MDFTPTPSCKRKICFKLPSEIDNAAKAMLLALALLATAAAQDMVRIEGGWATFGTSFADEDVPKEFAPKDEEGAQLEGLKE